MGSMKYIFLLVRVALPLQGKRKRPLMIALLYDQLTTDEEGPVNDSFRRDVSQTTPGFFAIVQAIFLHICVNCCDMGLLKNR